MAENNRRPSWDPQQDASAVPAGPQDQDDAELGPEDVLLEGEHPNDCGWCAAGHPPRDHRYWPDSDD